MPYKINTKGREADKSKLTDMQVQALDYLSKHEGWIGANEVAVHYGFANGWWFRGVLSSLHKKGLITKIGE